MLLHKDFQGSVPAKFISVAFSAIDSRKPVGQRMFGDRFLEALCPLGFQRLIFESPAVCPCVMSGCGMCLCMHGPCVPMHQARVLPAKRHATCVRCVHGAWCVAMIVHRESTCECMWHVSACVTCGMRMLHQCLVSSRNVSS